MDDALVTPTELYDAVLAAQKERMQTGDPLAAGTVKAMEQLKARANGLAWRSVGTPTPEEWWSAHDEHAEAQVDGKNLCSLTDCPYCKEQEAGL